MFFKKCTGHIKMMLMRESLQKIDALLEETAAKTGISKSKLMTLAGFESSQWRGYVTANRTLSDNMLRGLATLPGWPGFTELVQWKNEDKIPELKENPSGMANIPFKGYVTAGSLEYAEELENHVIPWPADQSIPNDAFALEVKGDSMAPDFKNGGWLLVRESCDYKNGHFYIIQTEDHETTFKVMHLDDKGVTLKPLNTDFKTMRVTNKAIVKCFEVIEYRKRFV